MGFAAKLYVTADGKQVLADMLTGSSVKFTKYVMGDANIGTTPPSIINDVVNPRLNVEINETRRTASNLVYARGNFTNAVISQGFYFRELALYALASDNEDDEGTEVCFAYGNAAELAEYIEAQDGTSTVEKIIALNIEISNAGNIVVTFDDSTVFALKSELNAHSSLTPFSEGGVHGLEVAEDGVKVTGENDERTLLVAPHGDPVDPVTDLSIISPDDDGIDAARLTWHDPYDDNWLKTRVVRKRDPGSQPIIMSPDDGEVILESFSGQKYSPTRPYAHPFYDILPPTNAIGMYYTYKLFTYSKTGAVNSDNGSEKSIYVDARRGLKILWEGTWNKGDAPKNIPSIMDYSIVKASLSGRGTTVLCVVEPGEGSTVFLRGVGGNVTSSSLPTTYHVNFESNDGGVTWSLIESRGLDHTSGGGHNTITAVIPITKLVGVM